MKAKVDFGGAEWYYLSLSNVNLLFFSNLILFVIYSIVGLYSDLALLYCTVYCALE